MENVIKYANEIEEKKRCAKIKARKNMASGITLILMSPIVFILSLIFSIYNNDFWFILAGPAFFIYGAVVFISGKVNWWINDV